MAFWSSGWSMSRTFWTNWGSLGRPQPGVGVGPLQSPRPDVELDDREQVGHVRRGRAAVVFPNVWVPSGLTWTIRSVSWLSGAAVAGSGPGAGTTSTMVPDLAVVANGPPGVHADVSAAGTVAVMVTLPMLPGQRARQVAVDGVASAPRTWTRRRRRRRRPGRLEDPRDVQQLAAVEEEGPGRVGEVGQPLIPRRRRSG